MTLCLRNIGIGIIIVCPSVSNTPVHSANVPNVPAAPEKMEENNKYPEKTVSIDVTPRVGI